MRPANRRPAAVRLAAAAGLVATGGLAVLAWLSLSGGGAAPDGYDPTFHYPPRADRLVLQPPPTDPTAWDPPGKFDEAIATLDAAGGRTLDPLTIRADRRAALTGALETLFGTPAAPTVAVADRPAEVSGFDLSPDHLAAGSRVYRRLCRDCHGVSGDGRGPTAGFVFPHPRDFRPGAFKVAVGNRKPTAAALARIIRGGVPGTAMQAFDLIPDADVQAVAAYVVHLSLRGEVESRTLPRWVDDPDDGADVRQAAQAVFDQWQAATVPGGFDTGLASDHESVRRGYKLFTDANGAGCVKCHQDFGRTETFKYTVWGTPARVPDLTRGEFRWGKEADTVAARIRHGIPASNMPANPFLPAADVADLTAFVRDLGAPARLPPDVRDAVYPPRP